MQWLSVINWAAFIEMVSVCCARYLVNELNRYSLHYFSKLLKLKFPTHYKKISLTCFSKLLKLCVQVLGCVVVWWIFF